MRTPSNKTPTRKLKSRTRNTQHAYIQTYRIPELESPQPRTSNGSVGQETIGRKPVLPNLQEIPEIATDRQVSTLSTKDCEKQLYLVREIQRSEQSTGREIEHVHVVEAPRNRAGEQHYLRAKVKATEPSIRAYNLKRYPARSLAGSAALQKCKTNFCYLVC